jgi:hypothetical protein
MTEAENHANKSIAVGTQAENEPGYLAPKVQVPFNPNAPIKTETRSTSGELLSVREIPVDRPMPARIKAPPLPTLAEFKQSLEEIGNDIDKARESFQQDDASLDLYYGREEQMQLSLELAELQAKIREKQDRLSELENKPKPRDVFYLTVKTSENQVALIARQLVEVLSEEAAVRVFGVSLKKLSGPSQKDVKQRYLHALESYLDHGGSYTGLTRNEQATADVIDKRAEIILQDVSDILDKEFFAGV